MKILSPSFYKQTTLEIAKNLLGTFLVHDSPNGKTVGKIVETEAYLADDPACHASRGETPRNKMMFDPPGHAYIYFIYGMYFCFNVVTAKKGVGEAVLIRALEPMEGIELMHKRRAKKNKGHFSIHELCNGPAKLVIAMGITKDMNGVDLSKGDLKLLRPSVTPDSDPGSPGRSRIQCGMTEIHTTTRIGIVQGAHLPYRFYFKDNPFISKR